MIIGSHRMSPQGLAATMETPLFSRLKRRSLPPPPLASTSNGAAIYDYPYFWDKINIDNVSELSLEEDDDEDEEDEGYVSETGRGRSE